MTAVAPPLPLEFAPFPKLPRLNRTCMITEKIDGTNAAVVVREDGVVYAQSRTKVITPESDNFGFARWVKTHEDVLREALGPGRHFGEWWGQGIQRGYGMDRKVFSLFDAHRWTREGVVLPPIVSVVPIIRTHEFSTQLVNEALEGLASWGSFAAPGFMKPEGIVVYLHAAKTSFKVTLEHDGLPKGMVTP